MSASDSPLAIPVTCPSGTDKTLPSSRSTRAFERQTRARARLKERGDRDLSVQRFVHFDVSRFQQRRQLRERNDGSAIKLPGIQRSIDPPAPPAAVDQHIGRSPPAAFPAAVAGLWNCRNSVNA